MKECRTERMIAGAKKDREHADVSSLGEINLTQRNKFHWRSECDTFVWMIFLLSEDPRLCCFCHVKRKWSDLNTFLICSTFLQIKICFLEDEYGFHDGKEINKLHRRGICASGKIVFHSKDSVVIAIYFQSARKWAEQAGFRIYVSLLNAWWNENLHHSVVACRLPHLDWSDFLFPEDNKNTPKSRRMPNHTKFWPQNMSTIV